MAQAERRVMYRLNVGSSDVLDLIYDMGLDSQGRPRLGFPLVASGAETPKYGKDAGACYIGSRDVLSAVVTLDKEAASGSSGADSDSETEAEQETNSAPKHTLGGAEFFFSHYVAGFEDGLPTFLHIGERSLGYATDLTDHVKLLVESQGKQGWVNITPLLLDLSEVATKIKRLVKEGPKARTSRLLLSNLQLHDLAPFFRFSRKEAAARLSTLCGRSRSISEDDVRLLCKAVGVGRWPSQTVRAAVCTVYKAAGLLWDLDLGLPKPPRPCRSLAAPQQQQQFLITGLLAQQQQQQQGFPLQTQALGRRPGLPPPAPKRGKHGSSRPQQQQQLLAAPLQPPLLTPGPLAQSQFRHGLQPWGLEGAHLQRLDVGPGKLGEFQLQQLGMEPEVELKLGLGGGQWFSVQAPNPPLSGSVQQSPGVPGLLAMQAPAAWHMHQPGAAAPGPVVGVPGSVRRRVKTNRFCAGGGQGGDQQLQASMVAGQESAAVPKPVRRRVRTNRVCAGGGQGAVPNLQPQGITAAGVGETVQLQMGGAVSLEALPAAAAVAGFWGQVQQDLGLPMQLQVEGAVSIDPLLLSAAGGLRQLQGSQGLLMPLQVEGGLSMDALPAAATCGLGQLPAAAAARVSGQLQGNQGSLFQLQVGGQVNLEPLPAPVASAGVLGKLPAAIGAGGVQLQGHQGLLMHLQQGTGVLGGVQWLAGQGVQHQHQQQQHVDLLANLHQPPPALLEELPYIGGYSQQHHKQQQRAVGLSIQHPMPTGVDVREPVQCRWKQQRVREHSTHQPGLAGVAEGLQHDAAPVAGPAGPLQELQGLALPLGVAELPLAAAAAEFQSRGCVGYETLQQQQQQQQVHGLELDQYKQQQGGEEQEQPLLKQRAQDDQAGLLQLHHEFSFEHALPPVDLPLPSVDVPLGIGLEAAQEVSAHTIVLPELPAVGGDDLEVLGMEAGAADDAGLMAWLDGVIGGDVPASPYG